MNPLTQSKNTTILPLLTALVLACFALVRTAGAADGGLPNSNTAEGDFALGNLTTGTANTAIDADPLCNMMMLYNTPYGCHALEGNMGNNNTAFGFNALEGNTMGNKNTAIGVKALEGNAMGNSNTAIGLLALYSSAGSDNIALGARAGVYHMGGNNNIYIGNQGMASEEGQIRIGSHGLHTGTYIAGIRNAPVTGSPVVIGMGGQLGVTMSSAQFKEAIKPMDKASEAILALKPVTFHYKKEVDPEGIAQFGLVAEQVEKVNPDLVARDADGKVYAVRYEAVNAMLLNEFLKEHRKVQELEKQVEKLTAGLQKVSAQLEASKPAPQVVNNNQ